jgi:hypothetical protein
MQGCLGDCLQTASVVWEWLISHGRGMRYGFGGLGFVELTRNGLGGHCQMLMSGRWWAFSGRP